MSGRRLVEYQCDEFRATVTQRGPNFVLWCTDYVANEWPEAHESASSALARLATLVNAVATDRFFLEGELRFDELWAEWVNGRLA